MINITEDDLNVLVKGYSDKNLHDLTDSEKVFCFILGELLANDDIFKDLSDEMRDKIMDLGGGVALRSILFVKTMTPEKDLEMKYRFKDIINHINSMI